MEIDTRNAAGFALAVSLLALLLTGCNPQPTSEQVFEKCGRYANEMHPRIPDTWDESQSMANQAAFQSCVVWSCGGWYTP